MNVQMNNFWHLYIIKEMAAINHGDKNSITKF